MKSPEEDEEEEEMEEGGRGKEEVGKQEKRKGSQH